MKIIEAVGLVGDMGARWQPSGAGNGTPGEAGVHPLSRKGRLNPGAVKPTALQPDRAVSLAQFDQTPRRPERRDESRTHAFRHLQVDPELLEESLNRFGSRMLGAQADQGDAGARGLGRMR